MKKSIFKPIILGVLLGGVVFFTGPLLFIILILKFIFTPFGMGRMMMGGRRFGMPPMGFAEGIRNMTDEQFSEFKLKAQGKFQGRNCFGTESI